MKTTTKKLTESELQEIKDALPSVFPDSWTAEVISGSKAGYELLITSCPKILTAKFVGRYTSHRGRVNRIPMLQEAKRLRVEAKRTFTKLLPIRPFRTTFSEDCEDLSRIGANGATIVLH